MELKILFSLIIIVIFSACKNPENKEQNKEAIDINQPYFEKIMDERREKDESFKSINSTPLINSDRQIFDSLSYYAIDTTYSIWAKLKKIENSDTILFPTTTDRKPKYYIYAKANFDLKGEKFELNIYRNVAFINDSAHKTHLFLPFSDYTSGDETYGGGRYLDLEITDSSHILIDFNRAYNPYCAYNSKYSCPIPPKENYLETEISAGEKSFKH